MRASYLAVLLLLMGCQSESALPIVSTTEIPGTRIAVDLVGPGRGGQMSYVVRIPESPDLVRPLGRFNPADCTPATLDVIGDGVCRIQWGTGPRAPYAVIDIGNMVISEDSNPANPRNVRFEPKSSAD